MISLNIRLFVLAITVSAFVCAMSGMLIEFKVAQTIRDSRQSRFELIARDVAAIAERNLALGVSFDGQAPLARILARRKGIDGAILSIDVIDGGGVLRYSSEAMPPRESDGKELAGGMNATALPARANGTAWRGAGATMGGARATASIRNSFDVLEGTVVVRFDAALRGKVSDELRDTLMPAVALAFVLESVAVWACFALLFANFERRALEAAAKLRADVARPPGRSPAVPANDAWECVLRPIVDRFDRALASLGAWRSARRDPGP